VAGRSEEGDESEGGDRCHLTEDKGSIHGRDLLGEELPSPLAQDAGQL
jgi:hypothetical protein